MTNESLLITAAILMLAFGIVATLLERVRHPPATPLITFTGIAGVYLGYVPLWSTFAGCMFRALSFWWVPRRVNFVLSGGHTTAAATAELAARPSVA